jgi:adenylate kinase
MARLLSSQNGAVQISTGDLLRRAVDQGTPLGIQAAGYMERGELVPDDLILGLVEERIQQPDCAQGFLLDGFPRTLPQASALEELLRRLNLEIDLVVNLEVPRELLLQRLTTRRTCSNSECQAIFNLRTKPPGEGGKCTECGSPVVQRADETEEAVARRLNAYREMSAPLAGFYEKKGLLFTSRSLTAEECLVEIVAALRDRV